MWRGSSVNSWPNIPQGFLFHKLLCFLIFDNIVCQFFTFYPTWDPLRKCWQSAFETRASPATFRSWESFNWLQRTVDQILKWCQKRVLLCVSQGYERFRPLFRQQTTLKSVHWIVTTWGLVCPADVCVQEFLTYSYVARAIPGLRAQVTKTFEVGCKHTQCTNNLVVLFLARGNFQCIYNVLWCSL